MEERIFEPWVSLESGKNEDPTKERNMGLGLFFARMVARAYGGDLRCFRSGMERGACFEIRLPLVSPESA
jgi:signal transduction histidine kinase